MSTWLISWFFFVKLVPADKGPPVEQDVYEFKGSGIALSMYNVDEVCHI